MPAAVQSQMACGVPCPEEGRPVTRLETQFQLPVPCPAFPGLQAPLDPTMTCGAGFPPPEPIVLFHPFLGPDSQPLCVYPPSSTLLFSRSSALIPQNEACRTICGGLLAGRHSSELWQEVKLYLLILSFSICEMWVSPRCNHHHKNCCPL